MKSIGFRLTSIMLCVILLGIGITVGVGVSISGSVITRESLSKVQKGTESESLRMDSWLNTQKTNIRTLAEIMSKLGDTTEEQRANLFKAVMDDNDSYFEVYMGYPDGRATTASGFEFDYSWWHANERGWYKLALTDTSRAHITSPYVDAQTGEMCITALKAVERDGTLLGVVAADIFVTDLYNMALSATLDSTGYAMLLDSNGDIIVHPDADYAPDADGNFRNLETVMDGVYADLWKRLSTGSEALKYKDARGIIQYYTANALEATGWHLVTVLPVKVVAQPITTVIFIVIPLTLIILAFAALLIFFTVRNIVTKPISGLAKAANDLAEGDIGIRVESGYQCEMGILAEAFQRIADGVDEQVHTAKAIADGDLTVDINIRSERDAMGRAFQNLLDKLNVMFAEINSSSNQVSNGSQQVAQSAQELASGSSEQAANIEELSSSLIDLEQKTNQNSENSKLAQQANKKVETLITDSVNSMGEMLEAMRAIDESSKNINRVIKVIDDIAFQTNILALNAAVEAARAGQHGKGFAVVADEVRNLAGKSAAAAKETANLIEGSSHSVSEGNRLVEQTNSRLEAVAENARESVRLINEVTAASGEQAKSINKLHQGMEQISTVVQSNSSTAEESAAASEEMSAQAVLLNDIVMKFKLKDSGIIQAHANADISAPQALRGDFALSAANHT